jgi:hypothetical protein
LLLYVSFDIIFGMAVLLTIMAVHYRITFHRHGGLSGIMALFLGQSILLFSRFHNVDMVYQGHLERFA